MRGREDGGGNVGCRVGEDRPLQARLLDGKAWSQAEGAPFGPRGTVRGAGWPGQAGICTGVCRQRGFTGQGNRMGHRSPEPGEWLVDWLDRKKKWKTGMKPCDNPGALYLKQWE